MYWFIQQIVFVWYQELLLQFLEVVTFNKGPKSINRFSQSIYNHVLINLHLQGFLLIFPERKTISPSVYQSIITKNYYSRYDLFLNLKLNLFKPQEKVTNSPACYIFQTKNTSNPISLQIIQFHYLLVLLGCDVPFI